jgi:hypothetical protein
MGLKKQTFEVHTQSHHPHHPRAKGWQALSIIAGMIMLVTVSMTAAADPCTVPDNGNGTVNLPPEGCEYLSPDEVHLIIDGLPPETTIELDPIHAQFFGINRFPGGSLGGEVELFESTLLLQVTGTGELAGFSRFLNVPISCEVHTGPRNEGDPVQTFPNDMFQLAGGIFGDPDFDVLQFTAGTALGLPSPGQTTLTQLPGGDFNVDSFFDIEYRIEFQGAPGSILEGFGGTTQAIINMRSGEPVPPPTGACCFPDGSCIQSTEADCPTGDWIADTDCSTSPCAPPAGPCEVPDDGTGTVSLPPEGCDYLSPQEVHLIIEGLPSGYDDRARPDPQSVLQYHSDPRRFLRW